MKPSFVALVFWLFAGACSAEEFLLYGGSEHDEFLGCLNCGQYDAKSICNKYGKGSEYDSDGIFNEHGIFGDMHSISSPWNRRSSDRSVPIIVDPEGKFYGYFTINQERDDAVAFVDDLAGIFEDFEGDLAVVRDAICAAFDST